MIIILFQGVQGWTAAALVAFGLGTMTAYLHEEIETYMRRGEVRV